MREDTRTRANHESYLVRIPWTYQPFFFIVSDTRSFREQVRARADSTCAFPYARLPHERGFNRDNRGLTVAFTRYPRKLDQGDCRVRYQDQTICVTPDSAWSRRSRVQLLTDRPTDRPINRSIVNPTIADTAERRVSNPSL
jgi:hypothetical protein